MAHCDRCGQSIEFRWVGGRLVPLHLDGPCGGLRGERPREPQPTCWATECPECAAEVFFIRHNGGSIWVDPPLGYRSLRLCNGAVVRDLTTPEERDTTPGFSFHVDLALPPACKADFEKQLATLAGADCIAADCFVEDTSVHGATKKHTTIMTRALGGTRYDLRFFE